MSAIQIQGLRPLKGTVGIQGSKNAVLPMMAASLLADGVTVIRHVPEIEDVFSMMGILESLGCKCSLEKGVLTVDTKASSGHRIPEEYVGKMRSSCLLLGPLLAGRGEAVTYYPGGCVIGKRPIDLHLYALKRLGASFFEAGGMILARADRLRGARIRFSYPSVGAAMGARIRGAGKSRIAVEGVRRLYPAEFFLGGDRICAGTYLAATAMTAGDVTVMGAEPEELREPVYILRRMGADISIKEREKEIRLRMDQRPGPVSLCTGPYPGFPTDLQSVFLAAASVACGESRITETVFEARFAAAALLRQFGARIRIEGQTAVALGTYPLRPGIADAPDLRGGAALVLAGLAADGLSIIGSCRHIQRGYEDLCRDLGSLGAEICWL